MYFKENKKFLSTEQIKFIEEEILGAKFPYYLINKTVVQKDLLQEDGFLAHIILSRLEDRHMTKVINSEYYDVILDILNSFLSSIKEKVNFFTRIAINLTYNNGFEKSSIHKDHNYDHKQIIIYLNDCDKKAKTVILNDKEKIVKEIQPEKYKGICFGSNLHYHFFPTKGKRIVLVATYI
jgi:hypothetical protein